MRPRTYAIALGALVAAAALDGWRLRHTFGDVCTWYPEDDVACFLSVRVATGSLWVGEGRVIPHRLP